MTKPNLENDPAPPREDTRSESLDALAERALPPEEPSEPDSEPAAGPSAPEHPAEAPPLPAEEAAQASTEPPEITEESVPAPDGLGDSGSPRLHLVEDDRAPALEGAPGEPRPPEPAAAGALPVDDFGLDPVFEAKALARLRPVYEKYFRVETRGLEHLPATGRVLLVANHAGALPWDVAMLKCAVAFDHPARRRLRPLIVDSLFHLPFVGVAANRFGAVRACQENAEALLDLGEAVAVFPEGDKGISKHVSRRYQLQRFGRGGFVRLALRTRTTIVPVAIVGAEETHPLLARFRRPARLLGLPLLPLTPTFPFLGPAGLLPLPTKWTIDFLPPVVLSGDPHDELTVQRHSEDVREHIQRRLDELVRARNNPFF